MRLIDAERLREELLWENVFLADNEIDALVDLIDNQPTIFPLNDPLTIDELRAMVGNPVYDCFGQIWYVVKSYYGHDLIMTDGTHFDDENKYAKVSKRFYCNRPTIPAAQWISVEERLPDVDKTQSGYEKQYVIAATKNGVRPLMFERACVRDKVVRRWKWAWDRIYDGSPVTHWMPLPEPPKEGHHEY